jgi:hypothetical protein
MVEKGDKDSRETVGLRFLRGDGIQAWNQMREDRGGLAV